MSYGSSLLLDSFRGIPIDAADANVRVRSTTHRRRGYMPSRLPCLRREVSAAPRARRRMAEFANVQPPDCSNQLTNSPTHQLTAVQCCAGGATKQRVRRAMGVALILCPLHHAA